MSAYRIEYRPEIEQDLEGIPRNIEARIRRAIEDRLGMAPDKYGGRLRRSLAGFWKLRVGDYRIVYEIVKQRVTIWAIQHRKRIYLEAVKRLRP